VADQAYLERLTRELIDKGLLIEAGWISLRVAAVPLDATPLQLTEMRKAFFAGAQHTFSSIMTMLGPGDEPTDADMRRMSQIESELETFGAQLQAEIMTRGQPTTGGRA
jgi:hypothetical protein